MTIRSAPFAIGDVFNFISPYAPPGAARVSVDVKVQIAGVEPTGGVEIRLSEGPDAPFRLQVDTVPYDLACRLIKDGIWSPQ